MPCDRLPFAVRVGCQIDVVCIGGCLGNRVHVLAVARDGFVLHRKIIFGIDCAGLGNQVAHVSIRGEDFKILAQIFLQRFGLGRRFDDQEIGCHACGLVFSVVGRNAAA